MSLPKSIAPLLLIAASLVAAAPAVAQTSEFQLEDDQIRALRQVEPPDAEIRLGVGFAPLPEIADVFSDVMVTTITLGGVRTDSESDVPSLHVEYLRSISRKTNVVVHFSYVSLDKTYRYEWTDDTAGKITDRYFTLMAGVEKYYLRTRSFGVYGDALLGATRLDASSDTADLAADSKTVLAFQVTPLGLHVGRKLALDLSAGVGYKGVFMASVGYAF